MAEESDIAAINAAFDDGHAGMICLALLNVAKARGLDLSSSPLDVLAADGPIYLHELCDIVRALGIKLTVKPIA